MCHLEALPGDPAYDFKKGMEWVVERARYDMLALQEGGIDAIMFSNERSLPYLTRVEAITTACMARVIGEISKELSIPFGVNVLWDGAASIDLAVATGAKFVREIFTGVYASDFGLWNTNCGEVISHQHRVGGEDIRLFFNILRKPQLICRSRHRQHCTIDRLQYQSGRIVRIRVTARSLPISKCCKW